MPKIKVGLIGSGFVADLHMYAYKRVYGVDVEVTAVVSRGDHVEGFAAKHGIAQTHRDYRALLADPAIDVIDICTPPALHAEMIVAAAHAGKHVICEKPFAGYFGRPGDPEPIGRRVAKSVMYERVLAEMEETRAALAKSGKLFMYAEDWVYAPAIRKTVAIIEATRDKILFMKAEESHSGSHAAHAAQWAMTGGGSLIRMGCHPLSAILYLKRVEARARGETIRVVDVTADVGNVAAGLAPQERKYIHSKPVDVEDWGTLTMTFSDGTKGTIFSGDMVMGGVRNLIETYTSGGALLANITPNNHLVTYRRAKARRRLCDREGRPQDRLAVRLPRGGMDARLPAGDPGLHGMRRDRPPAPRRSRPRLRDDAGAIRRLLVCRRRTADQAVDRTGWARRMARTIRVGKIAEAPCPRG
jgi:predicted dehydrogenase